MSTVISRPGSLGQGYVLSFSLQSASDQLSEDTGRVGQI